MCFCCDDLGCACDEMKITPILGMGLQGSAAGVRFLNERSRGRASGRGVRSARGLLARVCARFQGAARACALHMSYLHCFIGAWI